MGYVSLGDIVDSDGIVDIGGFGAFVASAIEMNNEGGFKLDFGGFDVEAGNADDTCLTDAVGERLLQTLAAAVLDSNKLGGANAKNDDGARAQR